MNTSAPKQKLLFSLVLLALYTPRHAYAFANPADTAALVSIVAKLTEELAVAQDMLLAMRTTVANTQVAAAFAHTGLSRTSDVKQFIYQAPHYLVDGGEQALKNSGSALAGQMAQHLREEVGVIKADYGAVLRGAAEGQRAHPFDAGLLSKASKDLSGAYSRTLERLHGQRSYVAAAAKSFVSQMGLEGINMAEAAVHQTRAAAIKMVAQVHADEVLSNIDARGQFKALQRSQQIQAAVAERTQEFAGMALQKMQLRRTKLQSDVAPSPAQEAEVLYVRNR